jgi:hypothetical protein
MCGNVNANQRPRQVITNAPAGQDALKRGKTLQNLALPAVFLLLTVTKGLVLAIV